MQVNVAVGVFDGRKQDPVYMARGRVILILDTPSNEGRILFRLKKLLLYSDSQSVYLPITSIVQGKVMLSEASVHRRGYVLAEGGTPIRPSHGTRGQPDQS